NLPIRSVSAFSFTSLKKRVPKEFKPKPPKLLRLTHENVSRGRHGDAFQRKSVETASIVRTCAMIAQAPKPAIAREIATAALASVAAIALSSSLRKSIERMSSERWTVARPERTKLRDSAANNGFTSGAR